MRKIDRHLAADPTAPLTVIAVDSPAPGHANSRYEIEGFNTVYNRNAVDSRGNPAHFTRTTLIFNSADHEHDDQADGITPEALLAVLNDHLKGIQKTPNGTANTQKAGEHIAAALKALTKTARPTRQSPAGLNKTHSRRQAA